MTDRKELETLMARMRRQASATIVVKHDEDGWIDSIQISGARGIGPHPMGPISAAERMREFLARQS